MRRQCLRVAALIAAAVTALGSVNARVNAQSGARRTVQVAASHIIPRDVADAVSNVFNASATLRLTGTQSIERGREVESDVAILDGTVEISGHVLGSVVAINSTVIVAPGARLERDITVLGGRLDTREGGTVAGDMRVYREQVEVDYEEDRIVVRDATSDEQWYRRGRWRNRSWSDIRLLSARTYNRVEGLPILLGPAFGRDLSWGRISADAMGILRSADNFEWKSENIGHLVKAEVSLGRTRGLRIGGQLEDVVDAIEPYHLSDTEVGLGTFLLHRDYRDYFDRHGGSVHASLFLGGIDVTVAFADERWGARRARTPFTLFRGGQDWRPNPIVDAGRFHVANTTWRYDTRNDRREPWSGWYIVADYEHGSGVINSLGYTSSYACVGPVSCPGSIIRAANVGRNIYNRGFLDLRRYNRVSPDGQLNLRMVLGGWLGGDPLPLERRFSVGGPGTLPGFDFRRVEGSTDYWQCSGGGNSSIINPEGMPAQCDRMALIQAEYRGALRIDPLGVLDEERHQRRRGWGRNAEWVVFADAGRGWLVGPSLGTLRYASSNFPDFESFRTDVGIGLRLDDIGLYVARAVSNASVPMNFFVRLQPRF